MLKYGGGISIDQELTTDIGAFMRAGWSDGQTETWMFTAIDRTVSAGAIWKGMSWNRPDDAIGLAGVVNGLARAHEQYLAAGGYDFNIGDGKLNYHRSRLSKPIITRLSFPAGCKSRSITNFAPTRHIIKPVGSTFSVFGRTWCCEAPRGAQVHVKSVAVSD